jgi:hypothetical protein
MKTVEGACSLVLREDEPAYPAENHTCPVCSARAWRREAPASCAMVEVLDERGAVTEWAATDVTQEDGDIYLTCEDAHIWIERSREVIDEAGYDGQVALVRVGSAARGGTGTGPGTEERHSAGDGRDVSLDVFASLRCRSNRRSGIGRLPG